MSQSLTNAQRLIWSGQRLHPGSSLYNMIHVFRIKGCVDPKAFERAFRWIVEKSDLLDLVLDDSASEPFLMERHVPASFEVVDLGSESASVPTTSASDHISNTDIESLRVGSNDRLQDSLDSWVTIRKQRIVDPRNCFFDSVLLRLGDQDWAWYFNVHHIAMDGMSVGLMLELVGKQYAFETGASRESVSELPQYAQLLEFEQKVLGSARFEKADAYWEKLKSADVNQTKLYRRETSLRSTSSTRRRVGLTTSQMTALRKLAIQEEARGFSEDLSFHAIILSLLAVFVSRISGNSEFALSMPSQNRPTPALKKTIGSFVELFSILLDIDPERSFLETIKGVRANAQQVFMHTLPGLGRPELNRRSSVVFNYLNVSFASFAGMPVDAEWIHCDHFDANHFLCLHVHDFGQTGNLNFDFDFATDSFSREQQDATLDQFLRLFDSLVVNPMQPVGRPSLVEKSVPQQTQPISTPPEDVFLRFRKNVLAMPDSVAVTDQSGALTYSQLAKRAGHIANQIRNSGAISGSRVGIYLDRSVDFVASILACLETNCAYVPVEKSSATDRARQVFDTSVLSAIITDEPSALNAGVPLISVESPVAVSDSPQDNPFENSRVQPDSLGRTPAYVIFTSGSSGRPKGVVVSRASLARYVDWAGTAFSRPGPVSMPLFTSLSYDLAITSIFVPLATGGTISIYRSSDRIGDASLIRQILSVDRHDVIKMTPSHMLVAVDVIPQVDRLQSIVLGGEGLPSELARLFADKLGDNVSIINEYGPTEATVGCMVHLFDPDRDRDDFVPIGKGNDYSEVLLLDVFGNEVPEGIVAEIAISGPGLADGYLNEPDLTAGSFVEHPFVEGATIYRTGDAAVRDESGNFTYLGRIDDQVKVAGIRIELGEIETSMSELPGIIGAAVAIRKVEMEATPTSEQRCSSCGLSALNQAMVLDSDGVCNVCKRSDDHAEPAISRDARTLKKIGHKKQDSLLKFSKTELHSFYVADEEVPTSLIREYLLRKLPIQAIPATFTKVESIPLTENGKVDRSRLLDEIASTKPTESLEPENEIEEIIHGIWCELLSLKSLSTDTHFLDAGGNSILAIQILARVKHAFDIEFPFSMAFEAPTIRELAELVEHTLLTELEESEGSTSLAATAEKSVVQDARADGDRIG